MSMLVAVLLGVLGVTLLWAGASGNWDSLTRAFLPAQVIDGKGSVDPNSTGDHWPDGSPRLPGGKAPKLPPLKPR